jgi:DNA-binding NarL/FixJ family response regulator
LNYLFRVIRIVIYEDNEQRLKSLEALVSLDDGMLFVGGYPDCSDVLAQVKADKPDVVLMDIEMPLVNGIEGVRLIKSNFPSIRVVMQTVYDDNEKIFDALKAGAEGYILKSTGADKTLQCITEVYNGGAFMTPSVALRVMKYFNNPGAAYQIDPLTNKEKEVLKLLTDGLSYKMVADNMGISYFTVNSHIKKIYEKLHVHSLGEAVSLAIRNKIV